MAIRPTPAPVNDEEIDLLMEDAEPERDPRDEDFEAHVAQLVEAAADYIDEEVGPARALATDYYQGEPFGDEVEGRSSFVSRDVRDTVQAMLPSLLRVFFGPRNVVEFRPTSAMAVAQAEQATDAVRHIVEVENDGFGVLYSAIKDALIRKTGILTWYYDDGFDVTTHEFTGLSEPDYMVLLDEPDVDVELRAKYPDPAAPGMAIDPATQQPVEAPPAFLHDVVVRRKAKRDRFVLAAIPPEEFLIDRRAASIDAADIVGWQRMLPEHELVSMGVPADMIEDALGDDELQDNEERIARDEDAVTELGQLEPRALYAEVYVRYDYDGDGFPELRKVCLLGKDRRIVANDPADERPFEVLCPDPEPHRWIGSSIADNVMDIQRIKSYLIRGVLDSLAQSIHPRLGVVDSMVNIDDVLNNENGAIIRMRQPGMVQPFEVPFVGQQALGVLGYMDEVRENRTGISKAAAGLDPGALQSSTRAAVAATISASQQQIEMVARILASSLKRVFRGIYRLMKRHQQRGRMLRLRGKWVEVDPRLWPAEMDTVVNVALGDGDEEKRFQFLSLVAQKQEQLLTMLGPSNPLVTLRQYRNTLGRLIELGGYRNVAEFFSEIPEDMPQQPAQPPAPDPQMAAVELQREIEGAKLRLQEQVERAKDDRERDKADRDFWLKARELELKYGAQLDVAEINAQVQRDRAAAQQAAAQAPAPGGSPQ